MAVGARASFAGGGIAAAAQREMKTESTLLRERTRKIILTGLRSSDSWLIVVGARLIELAARIRLRSQD